MAGAPPLPVLYEGLTGPEVCQVIKAGHRTAPARWRRSYQRRQLAGNEQSVYLHDRTGGMIGSLDQLIHEAANDAITDGTEKITKSHLDAVILDIAAQTQFTPPRQRRAGQR